MNALTDYTGTNPLLLKYSLLIFSNTKYLVNKRQIVETLPEGVAPAEISEDVPTVGVSPEVPSEGFSLQDFKDAILEISGTIFADYDPDTNDMSQPFRSFWNVCRVGLPQDATLKGFGRLMNGCFVTPINKLLLPTIGEDTYPSNLYFEPNFSSNHSSTHKLCSLQATLNTNLNSSRFSEGNAFQNSWYLRINIPNVLSIVIRSEQNILLKLRIATATSYNPSTTALSISP